MYSYIHRVNYDKNLICKWISKKYIRHVILFQRLSKECVLQAMLILFALDVPVWISSACR